MPGTDVAANIRDLLAEREGKQAELAELLGLTHSSISRRVRGEVPFRSDELVAVAKHFKVDVATLFAKRSSRKAHKSVGCR